MTSPLLAVRRCRRLMTAAGACASKVGMKVSSGRLSSYCGGGSGSGWGSPMVGRAHAAVIIARRLQRALAPSEFLGTRLCRSVASFSVLHDRIHPPGLACGWISNQSGGRTAGAPASAHQSRKMSGGNVFFSVTELLATAMLRILAFLMLISFGMSYHPADSCNVLHVFLNCSLRPSSWSSLYYIA
jgi:hypothetical protein